MSQPFREAAWAKNMIVTASQADCFLEIAAISRLYFCMAKHRSGTLRPPGGLSLGSREAEGGMLLLWWKVLTCSVDSIDR